MVVSIEVTEGRQLAQGSVKLVTGGDTVAARFLYQEESEFVPDHKQDPQVKMTLKNDPRARAAILAWAVKGCLDWLADGLAVPETVKRYTAEYRQDMNPLADFLGARCTTGYTRQTHRSLR